MVFAPAARRAALVAFVVVVASCSADDQDATRSQPTETEPVEASPAPDPVPPEGDGPDPEHEPAEVLPLAAVELTLQPVGEFDEPIAWAAHPDGSAVVGEKDGRVRSVPGGETVLDLSDLVNDDGQEQGLLGLAFDPPGDRLYVSYTDRATGGGSVIAEYRWPITPGDTGREVLHLEQPFSNHNGGDIRFGPDAYLYIGFGDGGSAGDPRQHGQNPHTLLGALLRVDPTTPSDGRAYGIPADNPFADGSGGAPEVYLYGVRNPWRFSFDPRTGDLWVADVGQNAWEEITFLPSAEGRGRGANLGWSLMEGSHQFDGPPPPGHVGPIFEYPNPAAGCSITGGHVYRGESIPSLAGAYLFADYCGSELQAIRVDDGAVVDHAVFPVEVPRPTSFGVDADGELVVLSQDGPVFLLAAA